MYKVRKKERHIYGRVYTEFARTNTAVTILGEGLHSLVILLMILGMAFSGLCWLINQIVKCVFIWCWKKAKKINFNLFRNKKYILLLKGTK